MLISSRLPLLVALAAGTTPLAAQKTEQVHAVTVAGRGPETYVLLSGMVGGVAGFRRLEARLVLQGYRVIVIDPYQLSLDSADVTFAALARRVEAVLAERGVTCARMVGHSHGAGVMLRVAARNPELVAALYFLDAGALAGTRSPILSTSLRLVPVIARISRGRDFIRSRYVRGLRDNSARLEWLDAETQRAYTEPMLDGIDRVIGMALRLERAEEPDSVVDLVARIHVPVTVLLGDAPHDSGPGLAELEALAPLGALVRIEHMAGVGHFPHEEAPDEVARLILAPRTVAVGRAVGAGR